jgi:hypothetical protein
MTATEARGFPSGELRASDADRDLALAELSEHFQTGRLTQDEFGDRSARALQAKTSRELSELFIDLPGNVAHLGVGHGGVGWLIPVLIAVFVVRRLARHR